MKHLGDITKINGAEIEPVDCITFGSPCQDLSVAGKRAGLDGERSGLFMEAIRVIKEMRSVERTDRAGEPVRYPRFACWENVPGAFSSGTPRGEDFRIVLEELARIENPTVTIPGCKKWDKAGYIELDTGSIAWRLMDAQYWGVPQRRKRITVIVDFAEKRAGQILFERTGSDGDTVEIVPPWQGIARNPSESVGECGTESAYTMKIRSGSDTYIDSVSGGGKNSRERPSDSERDERNTCREPRPDTFQIVRN